MGGVRVCVMGRDRDGWGRNGKGWEAGMGEEGERVWGVVGVLGCVGGRGPCGGVVEIFGCIG